MGVLERRKITSGFPANSVGTTKSYGLPLPHYAHHVNQLSHNFRVLNPKAPESFSTFEAICDYSFNIIVNVVSDLQNTFNISFIRILSVVYDNNKYLF